MTEDMLTGLVKDVMGTHKIRYTVVDKFDMMERAAAIKTNKKMSDDEKKAALDALDRECVREIDFSPPFRRVSMCDELDRVLQEKFPAKMKELKVNELAERKQQQKKNSWASIRKI